MGLGYLKSKVQRQTLEGPATPFIMLAITAASAYSQYAASNSQANAANKAAWDNYYQQQNQLELQRQEVNQSAQNEVNERYKAMMIDEGKIKAVSGEAGVAGLSLDRLINDADFQASMDIGSIESNRNSRLKQTSAEEGSLYARASGNVNQNDSQRKTALGAGLQIASATMSAGKDAGWFKKS